MRCTRTRGISAISAIDLLGHCIEIAVRPSIIALRCVCMGRKMILWSMVYIIIILQRMTALINNAALDESGIQRLIRRNRLRKRRRMIMYHYFNRFRERIYGLTYIKLLNILFLITRLRFEISSDGGIGTHCISNVYGKIALHWFI